VAGGLIGSPPLLFSSPFSVVLIIIVEVQQKPVSQKGRQALAPVNQNVPTVRELRITVDECEHA